MSRSKAGTSGDVLGVRPYRRGDSPRRIHWPQSARHDRLIVCELESTARPLVLIGLDDDLAVHTGDGAQGSREWAIRITASLFEEWLGQGAEIGGLFHGVHLAPSSGAAHRKVFLDALARLPDTQGPTLAELLREQTWQDFRGVRVLITTNRALLALPEIRLSPEIRLIVLHAEAFASRDAASPRDTLPSLPVSPWLWIDDPTCVSVQSM